jgi:hypothetical protein
MFFLTLKGSAKGNIDINYKIISCLLRQCDFVYCNFSMAAPEEIWRGWIIQLAGILSSVTKLSFRAMNLRYSFFLLFFFPFSPLVTAVYVIAGWDLTYLHSKCVCISLCQFDYLKSLEIEEKINKIRWCQAANGALFLLSTNDKTIKFWKVIKEHCLLMFLIFVFNFSSFQFLS